MEDNWMGAATHIPAIPDHRTMEHQTTGSASEEAILNLDFIMAYPVSISLTERRDINVGDAYRPYCIYSLDMYWETPMQPSPYPETRKRKEQSRKFAQASFTLDGCV
jgi:hypothetical protein